MLNQTSSCHIQFLKGFSFSFAIIQTKKYFFLDMICTKKTHTHKSITNDFNLQLVLFVKSFFIA